MEVIYMQKYVQAVTNGYDSKPVRVAKIVTTAISLSVAASCNCRMVKLYVPYNPPNAVMITTPQWPLTKCK